MLGPVLASLAFGFIKGLTNPNERQVNLEMDFFGPAKEEIVYRGLPFMAFGTHAVPFGGTAAAFAVDHILSDSRHTPMTGMEAFARFGDVLLGGFLYETAARQSGILGAIASHCAHNFACGMGSRVRANR